MEYIFFTGAPGSRWSGVSQILRNNIPGVDNTDCTPEKTYMHHLYSGHTGNYYGPGMLYGRWLDTQFGTREQWEQEIADSYTGSNPVKLILSHNFAHYLDELVRVFPSSKLVLCYRDDRACYDWWHAVGGWNIAYPDYSWYRNNDRMLEEIQKQNKQILDFVAQKELKLEQPSRDFLRQHFDVDRDFVFEKDVSVAVYG